MEHHHHAVLVVDDYDDGREAIVVMLTTAGFETVGAASGSLALDMLQGGLRPCVILLDVWMPGIDGWELWDRLKAHDELSRVAVVLLSADFADHERAKAVGIREFLRKPIDRSQLMAAVERHCSRQRPPESH